MLRNRGSARPQQARLQHSAIYLWTSWYRGVIVHAQPAAHSVPEDRDRVPLTDNDAALADYLSCSCSTIKPEGWRDQKSDISLKSPKPIITSDKKLKYSEILLSFSCLRPFRRCLERLKKRLRNHRLNLLDSSIFFNQFITPMWFTCSAASLAPEPVR